MDVVSMPEAAVYEDASAIFPENQVRMSWQSFVVQTITESPLPQALSHNKFRLRVLRTDRSHILVPLLWRKSVHIISLSSSR